MSHDVSGKRSAYNGRHNVAVTVQQEQLSQQWIFAVRLVAVSPEGPADVTVDATLELQKLDLKLELVATLQQEDEIREEGERLRPQRDAKVAALKRTAENLKQVREKLAQLEKDRESLSAALEQCRHEVTEITKTQLGNARTTWTRCWIGNREYRNAWMSCNPGRTRNLV